MLSNRRSSTLIMGRSYLRISLKVSCDFIALPYYFFFVDVDEHDLSRADIPRSHETPTTRLSTHAAIVMISRYHGRTNHNRWWTLCFRSYPRTERQGREEQEGEGSWIYGLILRSSGILDKQHSTILFFYCCFLLFFVDSCTAQPLLALSTPFFSLLLKSKSILLRCMLTFPSSVAFSP